MSFVYTKPSFLLLFITLFLITIPFNSSSSITSYDIRELKRNDDCFKIEASPWYISQIRSGQSNTTICSGTYLLGGYGVLGTGSSQSNVYIERSYSNLPVPHAVVYFSFTFWAIDSWNANSDSFNVKLDGTTLTGWSNFDSSNFPAKKCGNNNSKDLPGVRVFGSMLHTTATLTFRMISKLDQDSTNESFGIRDLIILIGKNTIGTPASICGLATIAVGNGEQCACPEGQYHASTGCTVCDNSCASCFGSSNAECYACKTGYSFDGNNCFACATGCAACNTTTCVDCQTGYLMVHNTTCVSPASCISPLVQTGCGSFCDTPCSDPTMYAYWNGTCNATCNAPLQKNDALLGYYKVCIYPCSSTQYLYWDGSCQPNCLSPLQAGNQGGKLYCYFPCNVTSPVLYWNGTCGTSCPPPLSTVPQYSQTFCKFPCNGSQFLYWNTSCYPACDFPLLQRLEGGKWFCDYPCLATKFLYWNGSCLDTCDPPLTTVTDASGKQYCNYNCTTSQFLDWNGTCQTSCPSPLSTRVEGGRQFCDYPCLTTQFMYWNGICNGTCPPPLSTRVQSLRNFCDFPCPIQTQYLYENGTCKTTCPAPLVAKLQGGKKFCDYPCSATQYLYWNGTCLGTCNFPLYSTNYSGEQYCNYPCLSNQFLYWDGTCNTTCYPPLQQVLAGGRRFCDYKCSSSQFLYWNKSCLSSCNTPLVQTTFAGKKLCQYPCATGEFLYQNGSCINECLMPFAPREDANKDYCDPICPTNYYFLSNGSCIASCDAPMYFQTNTTGTFCMLPCRDPSYYYDEDLKQCTTSCNKSSLLHDGLYYICFEADYGPVRLVKQLHYIRFLEINLPHRLQGINEMKGTNVLSLRGAQDMFPMLREWLTVLPLPSIFEQRNVNSMFFANFIDELTILAGILVLAVLFFILEKVFQCMNMLTPQTVFERLGVLVRWNLPLMILAVNSGDIIFYTTLEFRTYDPDYSGALLSLGICIAFLIAVIAMFVLTMVLVYEAQVVKEEMLKTKSYVNYSKFVIRWESFQVLFRGYKDTTWLDQAFLVIYCTRLVSPMLISAFLYDLPLLQTILYLAINLTMFIYVLWRRPIRKTIDNINLCLIEGVMLAINISALMLVIYDLTGADQEKVHAFLGDVIIYGNDCISFIAMTFLIAKLVLNVQLALSFRREKSAHEKLIWAQLLFIPLQQGCFGFEQVQIQPFSGDNNVKKKIAIEDVPLPEILRSTVAKKFHANNLELEERVDTLDVVNLSGNTTPAPIKKRMNQNQQSFPRHQIDSEYDDVSPTLENLKEIVSTKRTHNIRQIVPIGEAPAIKRGLSDDIQPVDVPYENGSEMSATSKMWRNDEVSQFLSMYPSPGKNERGYGDHDVSTPLDLGQETHSDNEGGQSKGNEGKKGVENGSDNNEMMNRINSMDKPRERLLNLLKEELPFQE